MKKSALKKAAKVRRPHFTGPAQHGENTICSPESMLPGTYDEANFRSDSVLHLPSGAGCVSGGERIPHRPDNRKYLMTLEAQKAYTKRAFPATRTTGNEGLTESVPAQVERPRGEAEESRLAAGRTREHRSRLGRQSPATPVTE
jgi:hypothetical protein